MNCFLLDQKLLNKENQGFAALGEMAVEGRRWEAACGTAW